MKTNLTSGQILLTTAALASIALATGCSSKKHSTSQTAYYSEAPGVYYSGTPSAKAGQGGTGDYSTYSTGKQESAAKQESEGLQATGETQTIVPLYKESLTVGKREVDAGSVRVKKVVKTEMVNQPVELRHEEVTIEREPASSGQSAQATPSGQAFEEQETVIQLKREEPVIEKHTASAGQVVLQRRSSSQQTNIQSEVRTEDVNVAKVGNPENVNIGANLQSSSSEGSAMGAAESAGGQATGSAGRRAGMPISDPSMLANTADPSLNGATVQFSNLTVQSVIGNVVVLKSDSGRTLYAVSPQGMETKVSAGDKVSVEGTLRSNTASGLSGEAQRVLSAQPIYIEAQKIEEK